MQHIKTFRHFVVLASTLLVMACEAVLTGGSGIVSGQIDRFGEPSFGVDFVLEFEGPLRGALEDDAVPAQDAAPQKMEEGDPDRGETQSEAGVSRHVAATISSDVMDLLAAPDKPAATLSLAPRKALSADQLAVLEIVVAVAYETDIDPRSFAAVAWIESRLHANAKNPNSSASGVFQFVRSTAARFDLSDPFDARANVAAAARLWAANARTLQALLRRAPTDAELYLAHQQGAAGAAKLILAGSALAVQLVGGEEVTLNGGSEATTAAAFVAAWEVKFQRAREFFTQG